MSDSEHKENAISRAPVLVVAIAQFALIHLITSGVIAFTHRTSSVRPVAFASILVLACSLQNTVVAWEGYLSIAAGLSLFSWMNTFSALDLFFHSRVTYDQHLEWLRSKKANLQALTLPRRIRWALQMPLNYRRTFDTDRPDYIPTRTTFVLNRLLVTLLSHITLFFLSKIMNEFDFSLSNLPSRCYICTFFLIGASTAQNAHYNTVSVLAVILHLTTWHQSFRQFLTTNADFITFSILRLKSRSTPARYSRFFFSFLLSALIHVFSDDACGTPRRESGVWLFFIIQPVAFAVEECAQWVSKRHGILSEDRPLRLLVGYVWVVGVCTLTWPIWFFPQLRETVLGKGELSIDFLHLPVVL
ncbi:hypothetical protein BDW59DRAFT_180855 [Aspergillus cavernicola]|uniref:Wax synthase domain-containing protein n=1 Tax=Aspergillus cavernicola TaxID=176166 RepID=A0ABR4I4S5_9EURO